MTGGSVLSHDAPGEKCHTNTTRPEHKSVTLAHQGRAQLYTTVSTMWVQYKFCLLHEYFYKQLLVGKRVITRCWWWWCNASWVWCKEQRGWVVHLEGEQSWGCWSHHLPATCSSFHTLTAFLMRVRKVVMVSWWLLGFPPITPSRSSQVPMSPTMALSGWWRGGCWRDQSWDNSLMIVEPDKIHPTQWSIWYW